jgi:N6-L-threonylcarbamoyladenine synthase
VVAEDLEVCSSVVNTQAPEHEKHGGVIPELASREHLLRIIGVVEQALIEADTKPADLRAVAVTRGPGLLGCLAVGISTAKSLGLAWDKPVVPVNHLEGHLFSAELERADVRYPAVILLVSGGHCLLIDARERGRYELLGQTRDDSPGEAFDKVARELGLGYPGGPIIDRLAANGKDAYRFPRPLASEGLDFSFSGLKTAVRRRLEAGSYEVDDLAASFAAACYDVLITKLNRAIAEREPESVIVVGGVAASPILRERLRHELTIPPEALILPALKYATDNAAMIGAAAWWQIANEPPAGGNFGPSPRLALRAAPG